MVLSSDYDGTPDTAHFNAKVIFVIEIA